SACLSMASTVFADVDVLRQGRLTDAVRASVGYSISTIAWKFGAAGPYYVRAVGCRHAHGFGPTPPNPYLSPESRQCHASLHGGYQSRYDYHPPGAFHSGVDYDLHVFDWDDAETSPYWKSKQSFPCDFAADGAEAVMKLLPIGLGYA